MAIYIYFVTAPYVAPGTEMAMLLFYNGLAATYFFEREKPKKKIFLFRPVAGR